MNVSNAVRLDAQRIVRVIADATFTGACEGIYRQQEVADRVGISKDRAKRIMKVARDEAPKMYHGYVIQVPRGRGGGTYKLVKRVTPAGERIENGCLVTASTELRRVFISYGCAENATPEQVLVANRSLQLRNELVRLIDDIDSLAA